MKWIDCSYDTVVGEIGYLVETINTSTGRTSWSLRDRPLHTNQSGEPRLSGWCGETDNKSRHAHGVWRVTRVASKTERAQIVRLEGAELKAQLERDGYPELIAA